MSRIRPVTGGAGTPVINIQATLRTAPEFCLKIFYSQCYLVATVIHIQSLKSDMCVFTRICIYTHILHSAEMLVGKKK